MQLASSESAPSQPVRALVEALFRHLRLFLGVALTVVILVAVVTLLMTKQYKSEMKLLLENTRSSTPISADRSVAPTQTVIGDPQINSELEVLGSDDVLTAIADPGWAKLKPADRTESMLKQHEDLLVAFRKRLKVEPGRKSTIINVSYMAPSSPEATQTLTQFLNAYLAHRRHLSRPAGTSNFFSEEADRSRAAWEQANRDLVEFQQQNQIVSVKQKEDTVSKQITDDEDVLRGSQTALAEARSRISAGGRAVGQLPPRQQTQQRSIVSQSAADQMRTLLVQLQNRRTELLTRYTPTNRLVVEVDQEIADTTASLNAAMAQKGQEDATDVNPAWQQVQSGLVTGAIERQALTARASAVQKELAGLRAELARLQSLDVRFNALEERQDQARSNFELFSDKRDQAQIEDAMDERKMVNVSVAESPTSTFKAASPKRLLNAALGIVTACFLAFGAVYCAETFRSTIASPRQLDGVSRFPVLATIPHGVRPAAGRDPKFDAERDRRQAFSEPAELSTLQSFRARNEA